MTVEFSSPTSLTPAVTGNLKSVAVRSVVKLNF